MSKGVIRTIIVLMSIALLGITIIQYVWLKRGTELNSKNFSDKVIIAMSRVKQQLEDDASSVENFTKYYNQNRSESIFKIDIEPEIDLKTPIDNYRSDILKNKMGTTSWFLEPDIALNGVKISDVEAYLKSALKDQGIDLNYEYGIYSNKYEDFIITNGFYNVSIDNEEQFSDGGEISNLYETEYRLDLFEINETESAGKLKIFFPRKTTFLLSAILPSLIASIVFTGLILFCFVYTITIILTQKKVSLMKTDFINNMTHEFKTPIATISLAADSIDSEMIINNPTKIKRFAGIIKEENKRMLEQVEKVLQIAKLDKEDFELKIAEVDINDLTHTAVEHTTLKVNKRGGAINLIMKSTNPIIEGDKNHISNVIHNLLDNANKYSKESPNITVKTIDVKEGIEIEVKDSGIGMSKEDLRRIFEKFYRVSTGNIHDVKGFGLGLSYVKAIVDAHKGTVRVKSELGQGSTFTVFFPRKKVTI